MSLQANELITGEARLSYVNLFDAKPIANIGDPKFSLKILIPKSDTKTMVDLRAAMQAAVKNGVTEGKKPFEGFSEAKLATMRVNLEDGDTKYPDNPECIGHWCLNAKANAKDQPGVLISKGPNNNVRVENQTDIYSGIYGKVHLQLFAYNKGANAGIGVGLVNVLKTRDGDPLGGAVRKKAEDVFGAPDSPFDTPASSGSPI